MVYKNEKILGYYNCWKEYTFNYYIEKLDSIGQKRLRKWFLFIRNSRKRRPHRFTNLCPHEKNGRKEKITVNHQDPTFEHKMHDTHNWWPHIQWSIMLTQLIHLSICYLKHHETPSKIPSPNSLSDILVSIPIPIPKTDPISHQNKMATLYKSGRSQWKGTKRFEYFCQYFLREV